MPPLKFKPKRKNDTKGDALRRLRKRWEQEADDDEVWAPEKEPEITQMFRAVEGGVETILIALRAHSEEDARTFISAYDALTISDKRYLRLEDIAFAVGIGSLRLAELAQTALYLYCSMQTKLLISMGMPSVTRSIIKAATSEQPIMGYDADTKSSTVIGYTNGDVRAMEVFGKIAGMVPVPKGAQNIINNNFLPKLDEEGDAAPAAPMWKDSDERLKEFHEMTEPKRLPSPESAPINIGGHIDAMQAETVEILRD